MQVNTILNTSGTGLWSTRAKSIQINRLEISVFEYGDKEFGELRVFFNTEGENSWQVDKDGLIYTDPVFKKELVQFLNSIGLIGSDCTYSEQGMQGDDYVSCDVGQRFINSWRGKYEQYA
jgi:hypothetical protein